MALLTPTIYKDRITGITLADLEALGVKGLLLDVDNTLTEHGSQYLDPAVETWLREMRAAGVALTVVSNSTHKRVRAFAEPRGLQFIAFACKLMPIKLEEGKPFLRFKRRIEKKILAHAKRKEGGRPRG